MDLVSADFADAIAWLADLLPYLIAPLVLLQPVLAVGSA
jgi:hypothetical protein